MEQVGTEVARPPSNGSCPRGSHHDLDMEVDQVDTAGASRTMRTRTSPSSVLLLSSQTPPSTHHSNLTRYDFRIPSFIWIPYRVIQPLTWFCLFEHLRSIWLLTWPSDSETPTNWRSEAYLHYNSPVSLLTARILSPGLFDGYN